MTTPPWSAGSQPIDRSHQLRAQLTATLRDKHALTAGTAVESAFLTVPREAFITPDAERPLEEVYTDRFLVTCWQDGGPASSSSAPSLMAEMLGMLDLAPGQRVLEIGTGTGYNAALMASIVGPHGAVVSVELDQDLAAQADHALTKLGSPVTVISGDGTLGAPDHKPFDRIIVTGVTPTVPAVWHTQLHAGGLLVVPLFFGPSAYTQMVVAFDRTPAGFASRGLASAGFMSLRGAATDAHTIPDLGAYDHTHGTWKRKLQWNGLTDLDEPARRRLLQTLLSPSRHHPVELPDPYSFALYATLAAPDLQVAAMFETGVGSAVALIDVDRYSIAALAYPKQPAGRGVMDLRAHGPDTAYQQALELLESWRQWSMPDSVAVDIDYQQRADGQPHWRLRDPAAASTTAPTAASKGFNSSRGCRHRRG